MRRRFQLAFGQCEKQEVSGILLEDLDPEHSLRRGAEQTLRTCHRSEGLIHQLMAVSGRQVLEPVVLSVNDQVQEMAKILGGLIGEEIRLHIELARPPLFVRADPAQMEQVLLNLVVNARDAMPGGGTLLIRTETIELDERGRHVRISVRDTGQGMDEETLSHVFEPFFTTKDERGAGLGLATAYGIVTQSGGTIEVESERGRGTTFAVLLPGAEIEGEPGGETLLVVEDDAVVRLVVREGLKRAGYRVLEARDGNEALRLAVDHGGPIHLLLSDVVMPGMDAVVLAQRLASIHPGLKTVYMSGHEEGAVLGHGLQPDEVAYLAKPFTRSELVRKIRAILDS